MPTRGVSPFTKMIDKHYFAYDNNEGNKPNDAANFNCCIYGILLCIMLSNADDALFFFSIK